MDKIDKISSIQVSKSRKIRQKTTARLCFENKHYKDSINRSYYAAFYAIKAVLALDEVDFKRHKDAVGYFN